MAKCLKLKEYMDTEPVTEILCATETGVIPTLNNHLEAPGRKKHKPINRRN
jgi:hypothetical protein